MASARAGSCLIAFGDQTTLRVSTKVESASGFPTQRSAGDPGVTRTARGASTVLGRRAMSARAAPSPSNPPSALLPGATTSSHRLLRSSTPFREIARRARRSCVGRSSGPIAAHRSRVKSRRRATATSASGSRACTRARKEPSSGRSPQSRSKTKFEGGKSRARPRFAESWCATAGTTSTSIAGSWHRASASLVSR